MNIVSLVNKEPLVDDTMTNLEATKRTKTLGVRSNQIHNGKINLSMLERKCMVQ